MSGFMLAIVLYVLQIYKKISKELSAMSSTISPFQNRVTSIAEQLETITLNMQYLNSIWTEWTGRDKCCLQHKEFP
jgi:uncharacterized protein YoxC